MPEVFLISKNAKKKKVLARLCFFGVLVLHARYFLYLTAEDRADRMTTERTSASSPKFRPVAGVVAVVGGGGGTGGGVAEGMGRRRSEGVEGKAGSLGVEARGRGFKSAGSCRCCQLAVFCLLDPLVARSRGGRGNVVKKLFLAGSLALGAVCFALVRLDFVCCKMRALLQCTTWA